MVNHDDDAYKLEQLLESLIKMVGKANQNVDSLQKRVSQLESIIKEQQFELRERGPIRIYSRHPQKTAENIPFHV
ncbi:hypothetical protein [Neobacillus vireti]|uniref:Uncharacterized protein n=1 Tax=Neobacillus vireti LMG 21834 TaxID=1131730 RepID=A0AB94IK81_9BACI|nr:hypothetical protein [Neobacillus vireti]ETI67469.1 hypothetical protein BAVI_17417 [Neobacillus vireti LMG 21834]KLT15517.1 hypothetical protein AA980_22985 [Neobacillus vireti]